MFLLLGYSRYLYDSVLTPDLYLKDQSFLSTHNEIILYVIVIDCYDYYLIINILFV